MLDREMTEKICSFIRQGNYAIVASEVCGVAESTFHLWMSKGKKDPESKYGVFRAAVKRAEAEREAKLALTIELHARKDWRAAAWKLERMHPERWSRRAYVEHQHGGTVTQRVEVKLENLSDGELELLERLAEKALPAGDQEGEGEEEPPSVH